MGPNHKLGNSGNSGPVLVEILILTSDVQSRWLGIPSFKELLFRAQKGHGLLGTLF